MIAYLFFAGKDYSDAIKEFIEKKSKNEQKQFLYIYYINILILILFLQMFEAEFV